MTGCCSAANSSCSDTEHTLEGLAPKTLAASAVAGTRPLRPHILLVLFDDLGYHDLGSFGQETRHRCQAPVMSHLLESGVRLTNFYSMPICSPTRAALMTGRYPLRYGGHVGTNPGLAGDQGWAPIGEPFLPERLRDAGYSTYMAGKWHLGRSGRHVTPTGRGFQEFFGMYEGGGDHWTHTLDMNAETRDGAVWPGHPDYNAARGVLDLHHDRWVTSSTGDLLHEHRHVFDRNGTHSSDVIALEASRMISAHDPSSPMFMYLSFQAPHWPVQNPAGTEERHLHISSKRRRKWCGLVSHLDDNVGRVIAALQANSDMWATTLLVVFSDNGGDVRTGASNHPFRGDKMTPWEGGTKSPTFIYSPDELLLPPKLRGTSNAGLAHVVDLFPTLLGLAGGDASPTSTGPLDGVDLWAAWQAGSSTSPRSEVLYNIDDEGLAVVGASFLSGGAFGAQVADPLKLVRGTTMGNTPEQYQAIRVGKWKLVVGHPGRGDWYGTDPSPAWGGAHIMGPDVTDYAVLQSGGPAGDMRLGDGGQSRVKQEGAERFDDLVKKLWLFDLEVDPTELHDLSSDHPDLVAKLKARLAKHREAMAPALITEPTRWTKEKRQQTVALAKQGLRHIPGHTVLVADWWEDDHGSSSKGRSRL